MQAPPHWATMLAMACMGWHGSFVLAESSKQSNYSSTDVRAFKAREVPGKCPAHLAEAAVAGQQQADGDGGVEVAARHVADGKGRHHDAAQTRASGGSAHSGVDELLAIGVVDGESGPIA